MTEPYYNFPMRKVRLDELMTQRGLAATRQLAQKWIMAGQVRVNGQVVSQPSIDVAPDVELTIDHGPQFVSRGGEKLAAALLAFGLQALSGWVCADVGASTGGFTDCLIQHGAGKVYAIDVGYGDLHWKLRTDPRVVVMERTNARHVPVLPEPVSLVTIDASFISLRVLLPVVKQWFTPGGKVVALIKPQFEANRAEVDRGDGVILDGSIHRRVLEEVLRGAQAEGFSVQGLIKSPLKGPKGNVEFLTLLHLADSGRPATDAVDAHIQALLGDGAAPAEHSILP